MPSTQKPPRLGVLEVEDLRIVDKDGSTLARLGRDQLGAFGLAMGESANGQSMIAMTISATGQPCLEIRDRQGNCRAALSVDHASGQIVFGLLDENERARAQITVTAEGHSSIGLYDNQKRMKVALTDFESSPRLPGLVTTFDNEGKALWQSPKKSGRTLTTKKQSVSSQINLSFGRSLV